MTMVTINSWEDILEFVAQLWAEIPRSPRLTKAAERYRLGQAEEYIQSHKTGKPLQLDKAGRIIPSEESLTKYRLPVRVK